MADALPLNRKEKFYTGTVFPAIVCADNFAHFNLFAKLLPGSPSFTIDPRPLTTNIQFFTEYSPLHSFVGASKARMLEIPASNETPDVAIIIDGQPDRVLIVLEAKVFDAANAAELNTQLRKQEPFIECVRKSVGVKRVFHAALIPEGLRSGHRGFEYPVVTWDALHGAYAAVVPDNYFLHVLGFALEGFESLRSTSNQNRGANADGMLSGALIEQRYKSGSFDFLSMGRSGGLYGPMLRGDIETGAWRSRLYEVRKGSEVLKNWFSVAEFVALLARSGVVVGTNQIGDEEQNARCGDPATTPEGCSLVQDGWTESRSVWCGVCGRREQGPLENAQL